MAHKTQTDPIQAALARPRELPETLLDEQTARKTLHIQLANFLLADVMQSRWAAPAIHDAPVELRSSLVHGKGVFATRDIAEGEVVTIYPCHEMLWRPHGEPNWVACNGGSVCPDANYASSVDIFGGHMGAVGDPAKTDDPRYLGHMINEGVKITRLAHAAIYATLGRRRWNVCVDDIDGIETLQAFNKGFDYNLYVRSIRDIKKDEELFTAYGPEYWLLPKVMLTEGRPSASR